MDRLTNFFLLFLLVGVFVFFATPESRFLIIVGALLSLPAAVLGFFARWLTLDAVPAATLAGSCALGLGGFPMAFLLLLFFLSGSLLSRLPGLRPEVREREGPAERRDGEQVWANSFWMVIPLMLASVFPADLFLAGAVACLAAATSDTWATELGSRRLPGTTWELRGLRKVAPGTDGGISLAGSAAGLLGSAVIAGAGSWVYSLNLTHFFIIFLTGFSGCLLDSYLGARFQRGATPSLSGVIFPREGEKRTMSNNAVNWTATGTATIATLIINGTIL